MAAGEGTPREDQTSASSTAHAAPPMDQEPKLKIYRPWATNLLWAAIILVSIAAILSLILYKYVLADATDVATITISWITTVGTIVVAYVWTEISGPENGERNDEGKRPMEGEGIRRSIGASDGAHQPLHELPLGPPPMQHANRGIPAPPPEPPVGPPGSDGTTIVNNYLHKRADQVTTVVYPTAKEAADSAADAIAPVLAALAGFVGALIPLAYPAGLVALWIQLSEHFKYEFYKALFAASLAQSAMVVGKGIWILLFSLFSALLPMWIWYAYARAKVNKSFEEKGLRRFRLFVVWFFGLYTSGLFFLLRVSTPIRDSFLFWFLITLVALAVLFGGVIVFASISRRDDRRTNYVLLVIVLVIVAISSVALGLLLARALTGLWFVDAAFRPGSRLPLIQAFLWFTVAEILGGAILFYWGLRQAKQVEEDKRRNEEQWQDTQADARRNEDTRQDAQKAARVPLILGLAVVYVGSVAAGVCLAGLQNPALPTVTLTVEHSRAIVKEAGLLSNSGSYWHVVDYCNEAQENTLLAIPNTSVKKADAIVNNPVSLKKGHAGMDCPPETTITSGPSGTVASTHARFKFKGRDYITPKDDLRFECRIDGVKYEACTSPRDYTKQDFSKGVNGKHTFEVRAKDQAENVDDTAARRTWTVDTIGPNTAIDSGPSETITSRDASFAFSSPQRGATFKCKLDRVDYKPCVSREGYLLLSQGPHTFKVRAQDALNNVDASPAVRTFTVDTVSPETTIKSGPSGKVGSADAKFKFASDEEPATFECRIDGTEYESCTSPMRYFGLLDGEHTFEVRAKDEAGNVDDTAARRTWTVC